MSARTSLYYDLIDALGPSGCAICAVSSGAVSRYFASFSYEQVNDLDERAHLRAARGFCTRHAWQWWEEGDRLGTAIVYLDVLTTVRRRLDELSDVTPAPQGRMRRMLTGSAERRAARSLRPEATCPACDIQTAAAERAIAALLEHLDQAELRAAYTGSAGLCLLHLTGALEAAGAEQAKILLAVERQRVASLCHELEEFVRKQRHEFRHEPRGLEQTSPRRALMKAAGQPGATWPEPA